MIKVWCRRREANLHDLAVHGNLRAITPKNVTS